VVLYLRMSDERQEHSIQDQRQELLSYAAKHGYKVLREYVDEGSAATTPSAGSSSFA